MSVITRRANRGTETKSPSYIAITSLTGTKLPKWSMIVLPNTVIPASDFDRPGVDVERLVKLGAIRPATESEASAFQLMHGESQLEMEDRLRKLEKLELSLTHRAKKARFDDEKAALFLELMKEWSSLEGECRVIWATAPSRPFDDIEFFKYNVRQTRALVDIVGRSEAIRKCMTKLAEPLLIEAAGRDISATPLDHFLLAMTFTEPQPRIGLEIQAEQLVTLLLRKLKFDRRPQKQATKYFSKVFSKTATYFTANLSKVIWTIVGSVGTIAIGGIVYSYLRSRGIDIKPWK